MKLISIIIIAILSIQIASAYTPNSVTLRDLGVLQLAAHDLFNVDRETEVDLENGKLDLSTLLAYGYDNIHLGGEPRNRENIILFSVAKEYGEKYHNYLDRGYTPRTARMKLIDEYHYDIKKSFRKAFKTRLPRPKSGEVTMTENLALRTIHDFLPGEIMIGGEVMSPVDQSLQGVTMTKMELRASSDSCDGEFNEVFRDIVIFIPPDTIMHMDLLERDSSFAEQFDTDFTFEYFMHELENGRYNSRDEVTKQIKSLFAKGMNI